jgi:hypothetical protein
LIESQGTTWKGGIDRDGIGREAMKEMNIYYKEGKETWAANSL